MEAPHLRGGPPLWLEWLVEKATPERDRDAIVGDLREVYHSNRQYVAEALRTLPRVALGRAFAGLNSPALALQLFLVFLFTGYWGAILALPLLIAAEAYQSARPPEMRRIVLEATLVSTAALLILEISSFQTLTAWRVGFDPDKPLALYVLLACPFIPPLVCGLSLLSLRYVSAHRLADESPAGKLDELRQRHHNLMERLQTRDVIEFAAFVAVAVTADSQWQPIFCGLLLLTAYGLQRALKQEQKALSRTSAAGIRQLHEDALVGRLKVRRLLLWLWCAVPLIALHDHLVDKGLMDTRPMLADVGYVSAGIIFFLGMALNRACTVRLPARIE